MPRFKIFALAAVVGGGFVPLVPAAAAASVPTCFGQPATIVGTSGADRLVGQSGIADVIVGIGGNDIIIGGDFYEEDAVPGTAPDLLCGGTGNDNVKGGPGTDKINGGDGDDEVNGERGTDVVRGAAGADRVIDESFADMDSKNDVLRGGPGADYVQTAWGTDKAYGEGGNDTIIDTECDVSYLYGGSGADTFESWSSSFEGWHTSYCGDTADVVNGGGDYDTAQVSNLDRVVYVENVFRVLQES